MKKNRSQVFSQLILNCFYLFQLGKPWGRVFFIFGLKSYPKKGFFLLLVLSMVIVHLWAPSLVYGVTGLQLIEFWIDGSLL